MRGYESERRFGVLNTTRAFLTAGILIAGGVAVVRGSDALGNVKPDTKDAMGFAAAKLHHLVPIISTDQQERDWNKQIAAKLDGKAPLSEGEAWTGLIKVVPAGETYRELLDMKTKGTPVNVRDFPGTYAPDGRLTEVIGRISQGAIITKAIIVKGTKPDSTEKGQWVAFRLGDVDKGLVFDPEGNQPNFDREMTAVIYSDFVAPVAP